MRKYTTECPVCHTLCFKKNLFIQTQYITDIKDGIKITRTYKRMVCFKCNKTAKWVVKDRFGGNDIVLISGNKQYKTDIPKGYCNISGEKRMRSNGL